MPKLNKELFLQKSKKIHGNKYDYSNVLNVSGVKDKLKIICNIHGVFDQTAEKHLLGRGCQLCANEKRKRTCLKKYGVENVFQNKKIQEKRKNILLQKYNVKHPIQNLEIKNKIKKTNIKKYGVENPFQNKDIIKISTSKRNYREIQQKIKETLKLKHDIICSLQLPHSKNNMLLNRRIKILNKIFHGNRLNNEVLPLFLESEYIDVNKKYKFKCKKCNYIFEDNLDDGKIPRCNKCYPYIINSKSEFEIIDFLKSIYSGKIIHGDRKILKGKEIDIFLPKLKLGIEFNGLYYHSEISGGKLKKYHLNKTNLCKSVNINLIQLYEDEWLNKKEIVKSRLKSILNKLNFKIFARKCNIKKVSTKECNNFLNNNHLQGQDTSTVKLGLYYNNELVSLMTFGCLRKSLGSLKKQNEWELYRFCSKLNTSVIGSANKLLQYFIKNYKPLKIISYCDKRWSTGNLYKTLKFNFISESSPNYFYTKDHYKRYNRFGFRKNILKDRLLKFDNSLSEWDNMKNNGWDRIWDCGCQKYEYYAV